MSLFRVLNQPSVAGNVLITLLSIKKMVHKITFWVPIVLMDSGEYKKLHKALIYPVRKKKEGGGLF